MTHETEPRGNNPIVRESYDSTLEQEDFPISPAPGDEIIVQSVIMTSIREAERADIMVDKHNNVYVRTGELPKHHHLNPAFRPIHEAATQIALAERHAERAGRGRLMTYSSVSNSANVIRDRRGIPDQEPRLLPGVAFHERLASMDPEDDDDTALPGFWVQFLAGRIEHSSTGCKPETVGLLDQPARPHDLTACISALLSINGTEAYVLIDSDSTTNSMTPEFANATRAPNIKLDDQVTLQLGCVGSRSRINYGTRVPVDFCGIKGHVYFDQVNLDRYDCVIGTPFLNRHGGIIDFGKRELRFANGRSMAALPIPNEVVLIAKRNAAKKDLPFAAKPRATANTV
jgi:hypothetical protein